ncbi:ABC transporter ATP-binding protein [Mycoplasma sp. SG1]|uniref:ABC transporter ATP-binding protein n=1 Tax=Mycoplasma sp. SG1 TaxID=2810348 RepID=UPI0020254910|nr:ABC transporter ATP-binding protein [Mycoplasma sp. SG1]URM52738.1 ABC transporter ATP-binding protein [Mycoplasma sp. SG1]
MKQINNLNNPDIESQEYLLTVDKLTKKYGHKTVVDNISFKLKKGEVVGIIGKNGAGKTTLVEMIIGIKDPTSGKIIRSYGNTKKEISQLSGIQFQDNTYPDRIKVKDLIYFYRDVYSGNQFIKDRLNELIDSFNLREHMDSYAKRLSGGQQQRLNILLAVIHNPKLLVLDELSTGLDIQQKQRIKNFIKSLIVENNWTVIMVSHNMEELEELCDRLLVIEDGKIVYDLTVKEVEEKYQTVYNFIDKYFTYITEIEDKKNRELKEKADSERKLSDTISKELSFFKKIFKRNKKIN